MRTLGLGLALALASTLAFAQTTYEPVSGQEGKDVVWVPTPQVVVDKMLDLAKVRAGEFVMDLGSGDGRLVITAAKRGARAMGVEYNPDMVELSKRNAQKEGVGDKATFVKADLFQTDFSRADIITMFLLPSINLKLRPQILKLKPGTRIVSNTFDMGEWASDETEALGAHVGCNVSWCTALLWIVPANAAGQHTLAQGDLVLKQEYQMLTGTFRVDGKSFPVTGRVRGEEVTISGGGRSWKGKVSGGKLEFSVAAEYEPVHGQKGKDAVWEPTPLVLVDKLLQMAQVGPEDFVVDLGSGDGRTVIAAARRGARALGVEYNPDLVAFSQRRAQTEGVADKASFVKEDLFAADFSQASVVMVFLLPEMNLKLRPKILALRPGTRVIANTFNMGDWAPDETVSLSEDQGCNASWCTAHLWIVPARVEGRHSTALGELELSQRHQNISGTLRTGSSELAVTGRVRGDRVLLDAGGRRYAGRVVEGRLELR